MQDQAAAPVPTRKVVVWRVNSLGHEALGAQKGNVAQVELPMRSPPLKGARRRGLVAQVFISCFFRISETLTVFLSLLR